MIPVTKTFLPPKKEYENILEQIWISNQIANGGVLHKDLQTKLKELLVIDEIILTTNGTLPLQIAIKALDLKGEIITTPFSYVSTTSSIVWENCTPVFVDINIDYLTIDENAIEASISKNTKAILATHVFGNPCNVEKIEQIATKYDIPVIYDAAHCFGVKYKEKSLFTYGDIATCSFHATKIFHTGEGGAIFTSNKFLKNKLFSMHNFGHDGPSNFSNVGINAKMSELQAGMGLALMPHLETIFAQRKSIVKMYDRILNFKTYTKLKIRPGTIWNYSYYPIIFQREEHLLKALERLNDLEIYPRRYFYPSLNTLPYVKSISMLNSEKIANTILCLPLYAGLEEKYVKVIAQTINEF